MKSSKIVYVLVESSPMADKIMAWGISQLEFLCRNNRIFNKDIRYMFVYSCVLPLCTHFMCGVSYPKIGRLNNDFNL